MKYLHCYSNNKITNITLLEIVFWYPNSIKNEPYETSFEINGDNIVQELLGPNFYDYISETMILEMMEQTKIKQRNEAKELSEMFDEIQDIREKIVEIIYYYYENDFERMKDICKNNDWKFDLNNEKKYIKIDSTRELSNKFIYYCNGER